MACILADTRELHGANSYLQSEIDENNKANKKLSFLNGSGDIQFKIKQLTVGDYSILIKDKNNEKTILAMVIERKTLRDLAASIKDDRLKHQHRNMVEIKQQKGCFVLYIIEGNLNYKDDHKISNIPFKGLHSTIRHNLLRGIPYIQVKDEQNTARILVKLARDILKLYRQDQISFISNENIIGGNESYYDEILKINEKYRKSNDKNLISVIDEVDKIINSSKEKINNNAKENKNINKNTINENDTKNIENEEDLFIIPKEIKTIKIHEDSDIILKMWNAIPGISIKASTVLANNFHISDIICANELNNKEIKDKIKNLEFGDSGMKFGKSRTDKIMVLAYNGNNEVDNETLLNLSIKIISEIPGLSISAAESILTKYKLRDICNGYVQAEQLTECKYKTSAGSSAKKINSKSAEKLVELLIKPEITKLYEKAE